VSSLHRRAFIGAFGSVALLSACANRTGNSAAAQINARVDAVLEFLYANHPETTELRDKAQGILIMPVVTKLGLLGAGGAYGRGALRVGDATVDYYSAASASFGIQIGAKQFAHVLFFMTNEALYDFRNSEGWAAGADLEYAVSDQGGDISTDTTTVLSPVIAVIFGQAGLHIGASLEGTKYTRIIP